MEKILKVHHVNDYARYIGAPELHPLSRNIDCTATLRPWVGEHWRDGRGVDYNGLENRRTERYRGFESLSLRYKRHQRF